MIRFIRNSKGQSLVEYLIIVALMGVAAIGVMRVLGQNLNAKFADITYAIQGKSKKAQTETVDESHYSKRDLSNFMNGAASREQ